jgi:hypothetical protein
MEKERRKGMEQTGICMLKQSIKMCEQEARTTVLIKCDMCIICLWCNLQHSWNVMLLLTFLKLTWSRSKQTPRFDSPFRLACSRDCLPGEAIIDAWSIPKVSLFKCDISYPSTNELFQVMIESRSTQGK